MFGGVTDIVLGQLTISFLSLHTIEKIPTSYGFPSRRNITTSNLPKGKVFATK